MPPKKRAAPSSPAKSPTPGPSTSRSPPKKRGRIAGAAVKTNKERALESTQEQHPSANAERTISYLGCEDAQVMLKGAIDIDDYKSRLPYFFGRIFFVVRDLRQKEREEICGKTLPEFARLAGSTVTVDCEEAFEEAYRLTQFHFISRIIRYGRQWIKSKAGREFISKSLLAKKRKKPTLCPQPDLPSKPEDMLNFAGQTGILWEKLQAIDFWVVCLCAFEVEEPSDGAASDEPRWFFGRKEKEGLLRKELDAVALELIRRYAVFEALHPGGYSSTELVRTLREVMPAVSFSKKLDLRTLCLDLGVSIKDCGERPGMPNTTINIVSYTKETNNEKLTNDGMQATGGNGESNNPGPTSLQKAELQQVDLSNTRLGSGRPALDDDEPAGYVVYEKEAAKAQAMVEKTFVDAFEEQVADEPLLTGVDMDIATKDAMLSLHAPKILTSDASRRADAYAKGNIWVRSLIGAADRVLEDHRLNALMMAAQQQREMIEYESQQARNEIEKLRKKHELLRSAWASVDQVSGERDALRAEQRRLESVLHGGGTIAGALSDRFQSTSGSLGHGGLTAVSKPGTSRPDRKETGLGFFALRDTTPPVRYLTGSRFPMPGLEEIASNHTSPSTSQVQQGSNHGGNTSLDKKKSDIASRGRLDSSSSTTSKIALSQPQSQQNQPQSQQKLPVQSRRLAFGGASGSGSNVATTTELEALRDQITEEIEQGRFLDDIDEGGVNDKSNESSGGKGARDGGNRGNRSEDNEHEAGEGNKCEESDEGDDEEEEDASGDITPPVANSEGQLRAHLLDG